MPSKASIVISSFKTETRICFKSDSGIWHCYFEIIEKKLHCVCCLDSNSLYTLRRGTRSRGRFSLESVAAFGVLCCSRLFAMEDNAFLRESMRGKTLGKVSEKSGECILNNNTITTDKGEGKSQGSGAKKITVHQICLSNKYRWPRNSI